MVGIPHSYGSPFWGFLVYFVTSFAIITAIEENASAAIIKTIMEDAPIDTQLMIEEFLMVQDNEKRASVNQLISNVFVIVPDDINHRYY